MCNFWAFLLKVADLRMRDCRWLMREWSALKSYHILKFKFDFYLLFVCVCCTCTHMCVCHSVLVEVRAYLCELPLSIHLWFISGIWSQVLRLAWQVTLPGAKSSWDSSLKFFLSHLWGARKPHLLFFFCWFKVFFESLEAHPATAGCSNTALTHWKWCYLDLDWDDEPYCCVLKQLAGGILSFLLLCRVFRGPSQSVFHNLNMIGKL